jgi:hypothetical protein
MVRLGDIAKDKITGFTGTVIGISRYINNCPRIHIQPHGLHEGKKIDSHSFDDPAVEFVKAGELSPSRIDRGDAGAELGDLVEDKLTGASGRLFVKTDWLVGCATVTIQPTGLKDGAPLATICADERDLRVIKRANPQPKPVKTGGPRPTASRGR